MIDRVTSVSVMTDENKKRIKEYYGVDVDSDLLSPMVDYIFKRLFSADDKRSKIALIDLLNSVLKLEGAGKIVDLVVINPGIPVEAEKRKKAIFDIRVKFNGGKQSIVEMQLSGRKSFKKRAQFVISKAYSSQDISGEKYSALKKCYLICILNFKLLNEPAGLVTDYMFRDKDGRELTDDETILFIQLPKVDEILNKPVETLTPEEMWGIFFRHISDKSKREKLNAIIERKEGIKMATDVLYEISQDEEARIQYLNELLADLDARSWVSDAWEEGKEEGIVIGKEEGIVEGIVIGKEEGIIIGKEEGIGVTLQVISALMAHTPIYEIAAKYNISIEQIERIQATLKDNS